MLRNTNEHKAKTASGTGTSREYGGIHIWARATIQALHLPPLVQITPWSRCPCYWDKLDCGTGVRYSMKLV